MLVKRLGGENHGDAEAPAEQLHSRESPQMWELAFGFEQMGLRRWGPDRWRTSGVWPPNY